jgi:mannosyltransferase
MVAWPRLIERFAPLALAVSVGAGLRFWSLDGRGYWRDEIFSVDLVRLPFGQMMHAVPRTEGTPPAYYALAWLWARIFGTSEAGLRSLSALVGTLTVVAVYVAAARLFDRRTAVVSGLIMATSPLSVWYGQEARSYALGSFAVAVSLAAVAVAQGQARSRVGIWAWAVSSVLALATHYFTVFVIIPEAVWLLVTVRRRDRRVVPAVGLVGIAGLALVPIALAQRGNPAWIAGSSLVRRIVEVPSVFLAGPQPSVALLSIPLGLIFVVALGAAVRGRDLAGRRQVMLLSAVGTAGVVLPLALALGGVDFFVARNVVFAWPPLVIAFSAALAASRSRMLAAVGAGVFIVAGAAIVVATAHEPKLGSENWRGAAAEVAHARGPVAVVLSPAEGEKAFRYYVPTAEVLRRGAVSVREIDVLGLPGFAHPVGQAPRPPRPSRSPPLRGFGPAETDLDATLTLLRLRAPQLTRVSAVRLRALELGRTVELLFVP